MSTTVPHYEAERELTPRLCHRRPRVSHLARSATVMLLSRSTVDGAVVDHTTCIREAIRHGCVMVRLGWKCGDLCNVKG
jgi:hypothetical protein